MKSFQIFFYSPVSTVQTICVGILVVSVTQISIAIVIIAVVSVVRRKSTVSAKTSVSAIAAQHTGAKARIGSWISSSWINDTRIYTSWITDSWICTSLTNAWIGWIVTSSRIYSAAARIIRRIITVPVVRWSIVIGPVKIEQATQVEY